ncbi:hypothetical protein LTR15_010936 [Elasticomyces elasticus]|nr:hypothetical protein LTR15_010936 [Elasticomyces elasticus]
MTNEPGMSASVSDRQTTNTRDRVLETCLAQRLKHHISQLHRETKALEEVKQRVHHERITTQQELRQLEIRRYAEDARMQEPSILEGGRMMMEREAIRHAEYERNRQFVLCALAGSMCFLVGVGVEVASYYRSETILGDVGQWVAVGGIVVMIAWLVSLGVHL